MVTEGIKVERKEMSSCMLCLVVFPCFDSDRRMRKTWGLEERRELGDEAPVNTCLLNRGEAQREKETQGWNDKG